jgi:hypothetical protein
VDELSSTSPGACRPPAPGKHVSARRGARCRRSGSANAQGSSDRLARPPLATRGISQRASLPTDEQQALVDFIGIAKLPSQLNERFLGRSYVLLLETLIRDGYVIEEPISNPEAAGLPGFGTEARDGRVSYRLTDKGTLALS